MATGTGALGVLAAVLWAMWIQLPTGGVGTPSGVDKYEILYGPPMYWSLEFLVSPTHRDLPHKNKAIRTRGVLAVQVRPGANPEVKLCEERLMHCLDLKTPAPEIADVFFEDVRFRGDHDAQVVGAFTDEGFLFWAFDSAPRARGSKAAGSERSLENLVVNPGRSLGGQVAVEGRFGGSNLFGDFPPETRRARTDWVLRDGPFSIWVTGVEPKGKGWRLDATARAECVWRLRVAGRLERHQGVLYLKARWVQLLGRDPDGSCG